MRSLLHPDSLYVVIPCRNSREFIADCLESLQAQRWTKWTAIVADDCSDDGLGEAVQPFLADTRISYSRQARRQGLMKNTVDAIRAVSAKPADIIAILDGDDTIEPECLEHIFEAHCAGYDIVYTNETIDGVGHTIGAPLIPGINVRQQSWRYSHMRSFKAYLFHMLPKTAFQNNEGRYFNAAADLALYFPITELAGPEKVKYIEDKLYNYRVHAACNFIVRRDEQLHNNWLLRSRPPLKRQTTHFDYVETVVDLEKSDIARVAESVRALYPKPYSVLLQHVLPKEKEDSWRAYHELWVEDGVFLRPCFK